MVKRRNDDLPVWIPDERRPRQWLDGILAGSDRLDAVPEHLLGFVREYLLLAVSRHADVVERGVNLQQRIALLRAVPVGVREEVKKEVNRRLQDKRS